MVNTYTICIAICSHQHIQGLQQRDSKYVLSMMHLQNLNIGDRKSSCFTDSSGQPKGPMATMEAVKSIHVKK